MSELMEKEVYTAAVVGNETIFSKKNEEQLLKKTSQNNNIIHIAAQHQQIHFIQEAVKRLPKTPICESLICDKNRHGNTPLHIAAEVGDEAVVQQLYEYFTTQCGSNMAVPWRVTNEDGNTPAHVALLYNNVSVAMYLVEKDGFLARITNDSSETLLHLAVQYHVFAETKEEEPVALRLSNKTSMSWDLSHQQLHQDNNQPQAPETFNCLPFAGNIKWITADTDNKKKHHKHTTQETQGPRSDHWPIIELLLKIDSSITCWEDANGATPLHRATSLKPPYCIPVIKAMLDNCPEAAEVYDKGSGQTVLHRLTNNQAASYKESLELLSIPQVYALRNSKNGQGDTPLHLAARNRDSNMVQALLGSSAKLDIKNKSGVSARTLVRQLEEMLFKDTRTEDRRKLTKAEHEAAKKGDVAFLNEKLVSLGTNFLVSQTRKGGNILHILMQCEFNKDGINEVEEFIGQAIQKLPLLVSEKDNNGDTPIHVLAKNEHSVRLLGLTCKYFDKVREEAGADVRAGLYSPPWRLKNLKGDTPLHAAIRAKHIPTAIKLLQFDDEVAGYVNNRIQTPLHLLAFYNVWTNKPFTFGINTMDGTLISRLIEGNADLPYMKDEDGRTPLLTAAQKNHVQIIRELYKRFPGCFKVADNKGRTMWHSIANHRPYFTSLDFLTEIIRDSSNSFETTMMRQDNDGNTPLHLAILNQNFSLAQLFLDDNHLDSWDDILGRENNKGHSSYDLIGSAEHLPYKFETHLGAFIVKIRSSYGVPTTKMGEYANTIGVVAALLATISFTAAFTVPGGLDSSNGSPVLLQKAAFQVFMVADIVALYSSVMVLICLLWIMTTTCKADSILLLDISVFLLRTSFLATLVTFMTGLYVTTIQLAPAIAISTCATCTLLIILMQKRLVMLTVLPICTKLILWGNVLGQVRRNLWSFIKEKYQDR